MSGTGTPLYLVFRIVLPLTLFTAQWILHKRARTLVGSFTGSSRWVGRSVSAIFILFNVLYIALLIYRISPSHFPKVPLYLLVYPTFVWHGATFFIFLMLVCLRIIRVPFDLLLRIARVITPVKTRIETMKLKSNFRSFDTSRRTFLKTGAVALSAYSFIGATKGVIDRHDYEIIEKTVRIQNLPEEFKGFTIGLMSDIHSSVFMTKDEMDDYVAALNDLKTDIIFVPGDFVNSQTEEVYPCAESFSALRAPYGVFGCLGNHDYFADVDIVAKEINGCGVKLLRNDALKIQKGASFINLVGVDDIPMNGKPEPYLERALSSVQNSNPRILLCHKPYFLDSFAAHNVDLTLAGHTHGGQVVFAKIGNTVISPATLFSKYIAGLYSSGGSQMYVTKGIGTVGVPFRINCPPELTKITLQ